MNSNSSKIGYDIEFQKFIGSISHSVVFFNVLSMITGNIENTENSYRHSRCSHIGKIGVCVTQGEMANYLCIKKTTVTKCMQNLISQKIIGMDYVILEMMRAPFFYIDENGHNFCDPKKTNLRFLYPNILEKTKCISDAVVHGHIAYWNKQGKIPLIQSMMEISRATGLTYRQIQFSIKKLIESELIIAETHVDKRYVLTALRTEKGVEKNVGGCGKDCSRGWNRPQKGVEQTVEILDVLDVLDEKEGGGEPPPFFLNKISDDEQSKSIEASYYKDMHFKIPMTEWHELQKSFNPDQLKRAIIRYNGDWIKGKIKFPPMQEMLKILEWQQENDMNKQKAIDAEEKRKEDETNRLNKESAQRKEQEAKDKEAKKQAEYASAYEFVAQLQREVNAKKQQAV